MSSRLLKRDRHEVVAGVGERHTVTELPLQMVLRGPERKQCAVFDALSFSPSGLAREGLFVEGYDMANSKTIFRTKLSGHFTTIPNTFLRDKRLSFRARGLAAMILSNTADWNVSCGWLETQATEGREAVRAALDELQKLGYATLEKHTGERGRFSYIWTFYDTEGHQLNTDSTAYGLPHTASRQRSTVNGQPSTVSRSPSEEHTEDQDRKEDTATAETKKLVSKEDSKHHQFIKGWTENFKAFFGFDYQLEGRDFKAVQELTRIEMALEEMLKIARSAWLLARNNQFASNSKKAASIRGFREFFTQIRVELKNETNPRHRAGRNGEVDRNAGTLNEPVSYANFGDKL